MNVQLVQARGKGAGPGRVLLVNHGVRVFSDAGQLLQRRQTRRIWSDVIHGHHFAQAGDAHVEEFVQVALRDGEKPHPFKQRIALIARLFQHAVVERQPAQLAVREVLGISKVDTFFLLIAESFLSIQLAARRQLRKMPLWSAVTSVPARRHRSR